MVENDEGRSAQARSSQFIDTVVGFGLSDGDWQRGMQQQRLPYRKIEVFVSLTPRMGEPKVPSLLIKGRYNPVTAPGQVAGLPAVCPGRAAGGA
jgi:hypothetical protein